MPLADAVRESPTHSLNVDFCPYLIASEDLWSFLLQEVNTHVSYQNWDLMILPLTPVLSALQPKLATGQPQPCTVPLFKAGAWWPYSASTVVLPFPVHSSQQGSQRDLCCGFQWEETSVLFDPLFSFKAHKTELQAASRARHFLGQLQEAFLIWLRYKRSEFHLNDLF